MHFQQITSLQEKQGGKQLGTLLWWSLSSNHIQHDGLAVLAHQHGLDQQFLPSAIKPATAFRRAWRSLATRASEGVMLRQIAETEQQIVIGAVQERSDQALLELEYNTLVRIFFDKQNNNITSDTVSPIVDAVRELYLHHQAYTTQDIRTMLTNFVNTAGLALREMGGVYFVPQQQQSTLEALSKVVAAVGQNSIYQLPIYDAPQVQETLTTVARASLDEEIKALQQELQGFDETTRQSTLERRLEHFDHLRGRVELFAGVLSFKADDLKSKLFEAQQELRVKLGLPLEDDDNAVTQRRPTVPDEDTPQTQRSVGWEADEAIGF